MSKPIDFVMGPGTGHGACSLRPQTSDEAGRTMIDTFFQVLEERRIRERRQIEEKIAMLVGHLSAGEQLLEKCETEAQREALMCMIAGHRQHVAQLERQLQQTFDPIPQF